MPGTIQVRVDTRELSALYRAAKEAPGKMQIALRRGIKDAAQPAVQSVKAAASFSSRIPGAVKMKTSFARKGATVTIYVDPTLAPEGAPINHSGRSGTFWHPTFGHRYTLAGSKRETAVPFLARGVRAGLPAFEAGVDRILDDFLHQLGFH